MQANNLNLVLAFEGATHKNSMALKIAEEVLGEGRKTGRVHKNLLSKNVFLDNVQTINTNYNDTGLFGIKVAGSASFAKDICNVAVQELSALRNISNA